MINSSPDPQVVHDSQVVGQWEVVEDPAAQRAQNGELKSEDVLAQLARTFVDHLEQGEREKALRSLRLYMEVFKLPGEPIGRTHNIEVSQAPPI